MTSSTSLLLVVITTLLVTMAAAQTENPMYGGLPEDISVVKGVPQYWSIDIPPYSDDHKYVSEVQLIFKYNVPETDIKKFVLVASSIGMPINDFTFGGPDNYIIETNAQNQQVLIIRAQDASGTLHMKIAQNFSMPAVNVTLAVVFRDDMLLGYDSNNRINIQVGDVDFLHTTVTQAQADGPNMLFLEIKTEGFSAEFVSVLGRRNALPDNQRFDVGITYTRTSPGGNLTQVDSYIAIPAENLTAGVWYFRVVQSFGAPTAYTVRVSLPVSRTLQTDGQAQSDRVAPSFFNMYKVTIPDNIDLSKHLLYIRVVAEGQLGTATQIIVNHDHYATRVFNDFMSDKDFSTYVLETLTEAILPVELNHFNSRTWYFQVLSTLPFKDSSDDKFAYTVQVQLDEIDALTKAAPAAPAHTLKYKFYEFSYTDELILMDTTKMYPVQLALTTTPTAGVSMVDMYSDTANWPNRLQNKYNGTQLVGSNEKVLCREYNGGVRVFFALRNSYDQTPSVDIVQTISFPDACPTPTPTPGPGNNNNDDSKNKDDPGKAKINQLPEWGEILIGVLAAGAAVALAGFAWTKYRSGGFRPRQSPQEPLGYRGLDDDDVDDGRRTLL
eukprot:TRINITY_DN448_c1_g1_i1.p1 TRINITY_DN448_c1_g1~~TRINITY_DN448_c1_g1_i1.p1  ORF type:complete len:618 (+),score=176.61 TRINITY_DN448_c1_g1_i1:26-1855(+)